MLINSKKRLTVVVIGLGILVLASNLYLYQQRLTERRQQVENIFASRSKLLSSFIELRRDQIAVMSTRLTEHFQSDASLPTLPLGAVTAYPQSGIWQIPAEAGQLTGDLQRPAGTMLREIQAALAIDPLLRAALQYNQEIAWIYFLSANHFIYLAPQSRLEQFHFSQQLYQRAYWRHNLPEANPDRRLTLHGPYQDLAGKGTIITFSQPVYAGQQFLGVAALDLQIDILQHLLSVGESTGESLLVSETGQVIAHQGSVQLPVDEQPPTSLKPNHWRTDSHGDQWLSSPLVTEELWVLHRIKRYELEQDAMRDSLPGLWLSSLLALVCLLAWRLMGALAELTRMTHTDPLTQTLNRRGFHEQASARLAMAQRQQLQVAVLLMDIDFFKKINDQHGHAVGDTVLKQVGNYLLQARRPFDLICRWGGEEFVALFLLPRGEDAPAVAERLRQQAQRSRIAADDQMVTLSGGLVLLTPDEELDDAIKRADELLYQAKQTGRNRIAHELPATAKVAG